jgi:hypothetical protein
LDAQIAGGGGAGIGGSVWGTYPGSSLGLAPMAERERERERPPPEWQERERDRERRKSGTGQYHLFYFYFRLFFPRCCVLFVVKIIVQPGRDSVLSMDFMS